MAAGLDKGQGDNTDPDPDLDFGCDADAHAARIVNLKARIAIDVARAWDSSACGRDLRDIHVTRLASTYTRLGELGAKLGELEACLVVNRGAHQSYRTLRIDFTSPACPRRSYSLVVELSAWLAMVCASSSVPSFSRKRVMPVARKGVIRTFCQKTSK